MKARAFIALLMALALKVNATLSYYQASDYMGENVFPLNSSTALAAYLNSIGIVGGGGNGISTNGGSGIGNTFTNAALAGQPMLPGWASLSNPTGALLGVGSDGTLRVSPNLGWSSLGLTGNIDTNSSDGIITNDPRALTLTNSANRFGGNGGSLTGIVFTIIYTNAGASGTNSAGTILTLNTNLTSGSSITNAIVTVIYTNAGGSFTNSSGTVLTLNTNAPGSGSVTSVTATSPLGATAGATPVISVASATGSGALVEQTGATLISPTLTNAMYLGPIAYNFTNAADDFWLNADGSGGQSNIISGYYELRDTNNNLSGNFNINTSGTVTAGGFSGSMPAASITNSPWATNTPAGIYAAQGTTNTGSGVVAAAEFPALTGDITTAGGSLATTLKNTGTAGTYTKPTFDAQGRETSGATAGASDLSNGTTGTQSIVLSNSPTIYDPTFLTAILGTPAANGVNYTNIPFARTLTSTNAAWTPTVTSTGDTNWSEALTNVPAANLTGVAPVSVIPTLTAYQPSSSVLSNAATGGSAGQLFTSTGSGGAWSNAPSATYPTNTVYSYNNIGVLPGANLAYFSVLGQSDQSVESRASTMYPLPNPATIIGCIIQDKNATLAMGANTNIDYRIYQNGSYLAFLGTCYGSAAVNGSITNITGLSISLAGGTNMYSLQASNASGGSTINFNASVALFSK